MEKRTFLKITSVWTTGSMLVPFVSCNSSNTNNIGSNWAGNYQYKAQQLLQPDSIEKLQELIGNSQNVHILGSRHSFNNIADSSGDLISLENFTDVISLDKKAQTVTVGGGIRYGDLAQYLHDRGYALHNLASLPHISVPGACATATHGSGINNGNLATAISAIEIVTPNGELVSLASDKNADEFKGAVVGLGGLGAVATITLDIEPTYQMKQHVYLDLSVKHLEDHFDDIMSRGYSVSFFTDWQDGTINQVWVKERIEKEEPTQAEPQLFDATLAEEHMHPIGGVSAENCTRQLGMPGPWHQRLPHFRMDFTPSAGEELQSEFFIPREHAFEAITKLNKLGDQITPHLLISEIRTIAADDLWMSMAYNRPSVALHFTWKQKPKAVRKILPIIEETLAPYEMRPHWGKVFTLDASTIASRYPKMTDFKELLRQYDPEGKFRNNFLDNYIYST